MIHLIKILSPRAGFESLTVSLVCCAVALVDSDTLSFLHLVMTENLKGKRRKPLGKQNTEEKAFRDVFTGSSSSANIISCFDSVDSEASGEAAYCTEDFRLKAYRDESSLESPQQFLDENLAVPSCLAKPRGALEI